MELMKNKSLLVYGTIITSILTIFVNFLANALPINNLTTGELSDSYPNLFVPAGYVFAIWGVIYLFIGIFTFYQYLHRDEEFISQVSVFFILSNIANAVWIVLWHYQQVFLSLLVMIVLLLSLIIVYLRLGIGMTILTTNEKLGIHTLFSIYLGWITVATVANVTAFLVDINWEPFLLDETMWTVVVLLVATIIAGTTVIMRNDIIYGLVPIWAFIGIAVKRIPDNEIVTLTAISLVFVLLVVEVLVGFKNKKKFGKVVV